MTTPQPTKPTAGWFSGRTRLITIVSVVAVGIAGASAVSANLGILDAAANSDVGSVSAAGDLTPPPASVIDVYLPAQTATTMAAPVAGIAPAGQEFAVDVAGTVTVSSTPTGLRLDSVTPTAGWTWNLTQSSPAELMVTMTNGARTLEFTASTTADGNIAASVNEPIVTAAPTPPASNGSNGSHDDDGYEGGEDDD
jgi:hypothetical protein